MELKRYFHIEKMLDETNAKEIWEEVNQLLATDDFSARRLIERSNGELLCTTDDPADFLCYHEQLQKDGFSVKVLPAFRPDKAVEIWKETFLSYIAEQKLDTYETLLEWLSERIAYSMHTAVGFPTMRWNMCRLQWGIQKKYLKRNCLVKA